MSSSLVRKIFTTFLPPPVFLEMPAVGFDISDEYIRFAELKPRGSRFELGKYGQEQLPKDVVEEGYIKNKEAFAKILTDIRKKHDLKYIKASLPEEKAYLFKTQIPMMGESDIRGALQFKIEENVPIALQDAIYDFRIINTNEHDSLHIDVGVTVMHAKVIRSYMNAFTAAGLIPLELRTEAQAIAHTIVPQGNMDTHIVVGVRETKTVFAIVSRHVVQFTSTIAIGGGAIAESIKNQPGNVEKHDSSDMFKSLVNASSVLKDEVQKLFVYWESRAEGGENKQIQHIIVSGANTLLGIDKYLAQSFPVSVTVANAWVNISAADDEVPPLTHTESLDFVPALGLALPHYD